MKLNGNKILVTGGTSGIGLALAKKFLELDNDVIISGRGIDKLNALKHAYPRLQIFSGDLSKTTDLESLIVYLEQAHPDLNVVINNAGVQLNYDFKSTDSVVSKIDYETGVNFIAPVKLCALLLPQLLKQSSAAIVNISSGLAISPKKSAPVYCGTKAAVHIFTKALRYQLEGTAVKVFEILPPLVETPMTAGRGKGKITPDQLVNEFLVGFEKDKLEINIGKTKLLRLIYRLSPALADQILKNG